MAIKTVGSVEEFKALVAEVESQEGYKKPIGFGIARVDRGQKNADKILQANYGLINWGENFGSAAVYVKALQESGCSVDFSGSEFVTTINDEFIKNALSAFEPFMGEARGSVHKNIQVIKTLSKNGRCC